MKTHRTWLIPAALICLFLAIGALFWAFGPGGGSPPPSPPAASTPIPPAPSPDDRPDPNEATVAAVPDWDTDAPRRAPTGTESDGLDLPPSPPEAVSAEVFDRVLDEVVDTCGLGDWSDLQHGCEAGHCQVLLAQPAPDQGFPNTGIISNCPAWKETLGIHIESMTTRSTCDDGVELEVASLAPMTLELRARMEAGELVPPDPEALARQACERWGR